MNILLILVLIIVILIVIFATSTKEGLNANKTAVQTYTNAIISAEENTSSKPPFYAKSTDNKETVNYNVNKYDVLYHDPPEKIEKEHGFGLGLQSAWVFDPKEQKAVLMQVPKMKTLPTYEIPGYYKYGFSSYIPDYIDSILLSSSKSG